MERGGSLKGCGGKTDLAGLHMPYSRRIPTQKGSEVRGLVQIRRYKPWGMRRMDCRPSLPGWRDDNSESYDDRDARHRETRGGRTWHDLKKPFL